MGRSRAGWHVACAVSGRIPIEAGGFARNGFMIFVVLALLVLLS